VILNANSLWNIQTKEGGLRVITHFFYFSFILLASCEDGADAIRQNYIYINNTDNLIKVSLYDIENKAGISLPERMIFDTLVLAFDTLSFSCLCRMDGEISNAPFAEIDADSATILVNDSLVKSFYCPQGIDIINCSERGNILNISDPDIYEYDSESQTYIYKFGDFF